MKLLSFLLLGLSAAGGAAEGGVDADASYRRRLLLSDRRLDKHDTVAHEKTDAGVQETATLSSDTTDVQPKETGSYFTSVECGCVDASNNPYDKEGIVDKAGSAVCAPDKKKGGWCAILYLTALPDSASSVEDVKVCFCDGDGNVAAGTYDVAGKHCPPKPPEGKCVGIEVRTEMCSCDDGQGGTVSFVKGEREQCDCSKVEVVTAVAAEPSQSGRTDPEVLPKVVSTTSLASVPPPCMCFKKGHEDDPTYEGYANKEMRTCRDGCAPSSDASVSYAPREDGDEAVDEDSPTRRLRGQAGHSIRRA